jgi:CDGSH-type Zn-finger protein
MTAKKEAKIKVVKDGPYIVTGDVPLIKEAAIRAKDGIPGEWRKIGSYPDRETFALCRCGRSQNAPYCDGAHVKAGFDGTETASRGLYSEQSTLVEGATVDMTDNKDLCMGAQFCHRAGGVRNLVVTSADPRRKELAIEVAGQCPSGRLVICEKDGTPVEPFFEKSISVTEDPGKEVSGPLWVKGGLPIESAEGHAYEVRNRVTLCRCGRSHIKPLCDGTHKVIGYRDGSI